MTAPVAVTRRVVTRLRLWWGDRPRRFLLRRAGGPPPGVPAPLEVRAGESRGAAPTLGVSPATLVAWSDAGEIPCWRTPGGHRRYRRSDIDTFIARRIEHHHERRGTA